MQEDDNHDDRQYKIVAIWVIVLALCLLFWTWIAVQLMK